jgi:acetolactate synthase I/II/III large subunit
MRAETDEHRVVDHVVETLAASGIDHIFGVDGANIEDLFDAAFSCDGVTAMLAKHEFSAATMADGYGRAGAGIGVVAATSGGGSLNLIAALGESLTSRVPVLALIGQPPTSLDGRGSFQDTSGCGGALDAHALFSAVSVYCRRVLRPADIGVALREALAAARAGGPAVLLLPKDVQQGLMPVSKHLVPVADSMLVDPVMITDALRRALGPVAIIAGEQVARDDARGELEDLRAVLRAWVAVVPDAKDVSGSSGLGHSSWLGVTGVMGHPRVADALLRSAVCLLVGTRLPVTSRAGLDRALDGVQTLSVGSARPYIVCAHVDSPNLRESLAVLTRSLTGSGRPHGLRVLEPLPQASLCPPEYDGPGIRYGDAMRVLESTEHVAARA